MRLREKLVRAIAPVSIPNITLYWVGFQAMCMMLIWAQPEFAEKLLFIPSKVIAGEWWRAITFLFMPQSLSPLWAAFVLYFFWLMGSAMEANWGTARYNLFLWIGALMSIAGAFVPMAFGVPAGPASNTYLLGSVFLAFAFLYPDFVIYLFFILPVKVKWLALITWIGYGLSFLLGDWMTKIMITVSVANVLIFFWREILDRFRFGHQRMKRQAKKIASMSGPEPTSTSLHRCIVCGATEKSHPQYEFRYCGPCGNQCYCLEHLRTHQHIQAPAGKAM